MSDLKKFFELLARDNSVKEELEQASFSALKKLLADKGLDEEAQNALSDAMEKVAEAHGLKIGKMEEMSAEELNAVVGGCCTCKHAAYQDCSDSPHYYGCKNVYYTGCATNMFEK